MNRFEAEQVITALIGRPPTEGDVLARDREQWRFDRALGPTVEYGTITTNLDLDMADGSLHHAILGANITVLKPKNLRQGRTYLLVLQQDATGGRLASWDPVFKWSGGNQPVLSTLANARDDISFLCVELGGSFELHGVHQPDFK